MAVLFVVYMPNEDWDNSEEEEPYLAPQIATENGNTREPGAYDNDDGGRGSGDDTANSGAVEAVPKILIDFGDDHESFSPKKPLLRNVCSDSLERIGGTWTGDKLSSDRNRKPVSKHQSLSTLDTEKPIPRQSSENLLTTPEKTVLDARGVSADNVVYKGEKVRFQVTKLDSSDTDGVGAKQPVAEAATSVVDTAETKDEKKESLIECEETDVVMERLTLKEVV